VQQSRREAAGGLSGERSSKTVGVASSPHESLLNKEPWARGGRAGGDSSHPAASDGLVEGWGTKQAWISSPRTPASPLIGEGEPSDVSELLAACNAYVDNIVRERPSSSLRLDEPRLPGWAFA
ncbi:MAG: hypothetical protein SGPRY_008292, partial [Prymnesium sp.]